MTTQEETETVKWAKRFVADCAERDGCPPLHVSGDAMLDVCRALLSSSKAERELREALKSLGTALLPDAMAKEKGGLTPESRARCMAIVKAALVEPEK